MLFREQCRSNQCMEVKGFWRSPCPLKNPRVWDIQRKGSCREEQKRPESYPTRDHWFALQAGSRHIYDFLPIWPPWHLIFATSLMYMWQSKKPSMHIHKKNIKLCVNFQLLQVFGSTYHKRAFAYFILTHRSKQWSLLKLSPNIFINTEVNVLSIGRNIVLQQSAFVSDMNDIIKQR